MNKVSLIIAFLVLGSQISIAQDTLQLDDLLNQVLLKNHSIQVAKNTAQSSENSATRGNAGQLPSLGVSAGANYSNTNTKLEIVGDSVPRTINGAQSTGYNASLNFNYTLFDGFASIYRYYQLKQNHGLADVQVKATIENTFNQAISAYYELARLQEDQDIAARSLKLSQERFNRVALRKEFGQATQLEVLNAKVDLHTDSVNHMTAQLNYENARRNLLYLAGQNPDQEFLVSTRVDFQDGLELESLRKLARENNTSILVAMYNLEIAKSNAQIVSAGRLPTVGVNASYGLNQSNNDAGVLASNRAIGLSGGITLSYNLFDGGRTNINIQNAALAVESNKEQKVDAEELINKEVANGLATYEQRLEVLKVELANLATAELNFQRSQEALKLGQITGTAFREAQLNLIRSQNRINQARYSAKIAETELLRLTGQLVSD